jgi:hypothetical protein
MQDFRGNGEEHEERSSAGLNTFEISGCIGY